jgi:hypothetical protein
VETWFAFGLTPRLGAKVDFARSKRDVCDDADEEVTAKVRTEPLDARNGVRRNETLSAASAATVPSRPATEKPGCP